MTLSLLFAPLSALTSISLAHNWCFTMIEWSEWLGGKSSWSLVSVSSLINYGSMGFFSLPLKGGRIKVQVYQINPWYPETSTMNVVNLYHEVLRWRMWAWLSFRSSHSCYFLPGMLGQIIPQESLFWLSVVFQFLRRFAHVFQVSFILLTRVKSKWGCK